MPYTLNATVNSLLDREEQPEEAALALFHSLMQRFGWSGTVMTRADAESIAERDLTEQEWEEVRNQKPWTDAGSIWNEDGITWECIRAALENAGIEGST